MVNLFLLQDKTMLEQNDPVVIENERCVFWDFTLENGAGDWSIKGCIRVKMPGTDRVVCHCDHLTSFAVIVVRRLN
jgi:hypothetical protein